MTIPLQSSVVYGPVSSRRFGASLGVNLLSNVQKICNFDCVYCQYDTVPSVGRAAFPTLQEIVSTTAARLKDLDRNGEPVDCITIAGNGEPTLHPDFANVIDALIAVRDKVRPGLPLTILSNGSTCHQPKVRKALAKLDGRFMKLDAGREPVFRAVNLPTTAVMWSELIENLRSMKDIVLQSMFFGGKIQNMDRLSVDAWIAAVEHVHPDEVQIYTIDRPARDTRLLPATFNALDEIAVRLFERTGIRGNVFARETQAAA